MRIGFALIFSGLACGAAHAAIVVNGSFELGIGPPAIIKTLNPGVNGNDLTGWSVTVKNIDWYRRWTASDGNYSLDMVGSQGNGARLTQTLNLVAGRRYLLTFDQSANPGTLVSENPFTLDVLLNNVFAGSFAYVRTGAETEANMMWVARSLVFVAPANATALTFTNTAGAERGGAALDNVAVDPVPEPAAWTLLIAGFGLVGHALRRQRPTAPG
jgi:choice-of-anchor C domain-containing protein